MSFLKCKSVPNGVRAAGSSRTSTSRLPIVTWEMPKGGRVWVRPAREISVGGAQIALDIVAQQRLRTGCKRH
jgi:hypothetical protein